MAMAKFPRLLFLAFLASAPIEACATTISGLPPIAGDASGIGTSDATGAVADGGGMVDTAMADDLTSIDAGDDSTGGAQDGPSSDAANPGVDATQGGSDAGDSGSGPVDAQPDTYVVILDANAMCGSNILAPTTAVASSVAPPGTLVATNAIDGNLATRWESVHAVDPQWIYVDFGIPVFINRVQIAWETACAKNYDIQTSNDAVTWTTMRSITANSLGVGPLPPTDWTMAANHTGFTGVGRYLRINGTARCTQYGYSMWEMRVYGDTNSICHP